MKIIDIYYQGEGVGALEHLELAAEATFAALQAAIAEKHAIAGEIALFLEDEDEPIDGKAKLCDKAGRAGIKAHVHRCRTIEAIVHFKDKTVRHEFAPGATTVVSARTIGRSLQVDLDQLADRAARRLGHRWSGVRPEVRL